VVRGAAPGPISPLRIWRERCLGGRPDHLDRSIGPWCGTVQALRRSPPAGASSGRVPETHHRGSSSSRATPPGLHPEIVLHPADRRPTSCAAPTARRRSAVERADGSARRRVPRRCVRRALPSLSERCRAASSRARASTARGAMPSGAQKHSKPPQGRSTARSAARGKQQGPAAAQPGPTKSPPPPPAACWADPNWGLAHPPVCLSGHRLIRNAGGNDDAV